MAKQYIGSDECWIDLVNQKYDDNERHSKEQMQKTIQEVSVTRLLEPFLVNSQ